MKVRSINIEYVITAVAWIIIYACSPLYIWYSDTLNGDGFNVGRMYGMWMTTTAFLLLYVVHHFILMPKLFMRKRYRAYALALTLCMTVFTIQLISHAPKPLRPDKNVHRRYEAQPPQKHRGDEGRPMGHHKPQTLAPPDVACMLIALLMMGMDLGIVAWFNSQNLQRRLLLLEQQNLRQKLEHLRYQINPHFFMNTLNNIHVLVDVDQERAKRAIIDLSGLMRHSLYNGSESLTPLQNEIAFLRQYISLMELRFGNNVLLDYHLPDAPSMDTMVPPLLFATFVENAFKHGISHKAPSFVNVSLVVDDSTKTIRFRCENSRNDTSASTPDGYHGIGLDNVKKRLDLQYGDDYSLVINDTNPEIFTVELNLRGNHLSL